MDARARTPGPGPLCGRAAARGRDGGSCDPAQPAPRRAGPGRPRPPNARSGPKPRPWDARRQTARAAPAGDLEEAFDLHQLDATRLPVTGFFYGHGGTLQILSIAILPVRR